MAKESCRDRLFPVAYRKKATVKDEFEKNI